MYQLLAGTVAAVLAVAGQDSSPGWQFERRAGGETSSGVPSDGVCVCEREFVWRARSGIGCRSRLSMREQSVALVVAVVRTEQPASVYNHFLRACRPHNF